MGSVDHLVIAGGDLADLSDWFRSVSGVEPVPGGAHTGVGTRNALVGLGGGTYLELIAPDPDQPAPPAPRPFGIDGLGPNDRRLTTWAVAVADIDAAVADLAAIGLDPGPARSMSRRRTDGEVLAWRLTEATWPADGGTVPFLISWGGTRHPSTDLGEPCGLDRLAVVHPDPARIGAALAALDLDLDVIPGGRAGLVATIRTPRGALTLS